MNIQESLQAAFGVAKSYPELAALLLQMGIDSYTVDTASGIILYRLPGGEHVLHNGTGTNRSIAPVFSEQDTIQASGTASRGKSTTRVLWMLLRGQAYTCMRLHWPVTTKG